MLWLIVGDASHNIIGCNTCEKNGMHQVWVERVNGKTLKVRESKNKNDVQIVKEAIDYAIENGHKTLNLN